MYGRSLLGMGGWGCCSKAQGDACTANVLTRANPHLLLLRH